MAILSLVAVMSLGAFSSYQRRANIEATANEISGLLERARTLAVVNFNDKVYGVHFASQQYTLFSGPAYVAGATGNEVKTLTRFRFQTPAAFSDGASGASADVLFQALNGHTVNTGSVRLETVADTSISKLITVNSLGIITIQ